MRNVLGLLGGFAISALGLLIVISSNQDLLGVILIAMGVGIAALLRQEAPGARRR